VWKQNRSNAKNKSNLNLLAAVIHKNERNAAGYDKKVVHPALDVIYLHLLPALRRNKPWPQGAHRDFLPGRRFK